MSELVQTVDEKLPLNVVSYGEEEIMEVVDSLRSGYVTMGKKVREFERRWAAYIGTEDAVMVNSGSSANLLALIALGLPKGSEVITPALTWATAVWPIAQAGYVPVLVDVDLDTYNMSEGSVIAGVSEETAAIMPVHLLGNPCGRTQYPVLIEDACEAHGAEIGGRKVGSFGKFGTFSFFFSHHISTIEGGMVVGKAADLENIRALRAFGWIRDLATRGHIAAKNPDIDPRFLFQLPGYNMRPTELAGAMGMHQVGRLEGYIEKRRENAFYWNAQLNRYSEWIQTQREQPGTRHVWFAYPVMVRPGAPFTRKELQDYLESRGVETRPIEAGNIAMQPALQQIPHRIAGPLTNASYIHHNSFFWGNSHGYTEAQREAVVGYVREFMGRY